jgi:hypothetical protein
MDNRALESGAAASPPNPPASPSMGYPSKGNPATGTPAAKGGEYWFYQIGEELRAILAAASITPDHTNLTQLLTALRSAGVFQTAAQFDSTTLPATTEFVRRELGSLRGIAGVSDPLTVSHVGYAVNMTAGSSTTLPLTAGLPNGACIHFFNFSASSATINRQGSNTITAGQTTGLTTYTLQPGDVVTFVVQSSASGTWIINGGSGLLKYSHGFGASLTSNGWQRFPSGLIVQWIQSTASIAAGGNLLLTLPMAFPTTFFMPIVTPRNGQIANAGLMCALPSGLTGVTVYNNGSAAFNGAFVLALGF